MINAAVAVNTGEFTKIFQTVKNVTALNDNPRISYKEFATTDSFYRPVDSEFIGTRVDKLGRLVQLYACNFGVSLLVLSFTSQGAFKHRLYQTTDRSGLYLNEVFELIDLDL